MHAVAPSGPDPLPAAPPVILRPAKPEDEPFERLAYAASRAFEMERAGWPEQERGAFLDSQFALQRRHYITAYPGVEFLIIVIGGADAGRLVVHRGERVTELMDIVLLPAWRGRGLGTALVRRYMDETAARGGVMRLWVEGFNPALRLYTRLGFRHVSDHGPHRELIWERQDAAGEREL